MDFSAGPRDEAADAGERRAFAQDRVLRFPWGAGTVAVAVAIVAFVSLWSSVLIGHRVLIAGDVLFQFPPWKGSPVAHSPANGLLADPIDQFLPWQEQVSRAYRSGTLPLWNPNAYGGVSLLANPQSAPFSPYTWVALPFDAARGLSLAMLLKLWVAGIGMALFLRALGTRPLPAVVAGFAYATCSSVITWLAWPLAAVLSLTPWAFAAVERYIARPTGLALGGLSVVVALMLFAGHPETFANVIVGLAIYALVRCAANRLWLRLLGVAAGIITGVLLAGIQIVPFLDELSYTPLSSGRAGIGLFHLPLQNIVTWLAPNLYGNPGIDGRMGRPPNYNEGTGFVGVGVLVLAALAVIRSSPQDRSRIAALVSVGVLGAAVAYGALTPIFGVLPLFSTARNTRFLALACFAAVALAGLGLDGLLSATRRLHRRGVLLVVRPMGSLCLLGLALTSIEFVREGRAVDQLLPAGPHRIILFWFVVALLSAGSALCFATEGVAGRSRWSTAGFCVLVLLEGCLFAGPYNPRVRPSDVPPANTAVDWLQHHRGQYYVAALGFDLLPETASLYGLFDVRGYEASLVDSRHFAFWSSADAGFHSIRQGGLGVVHDPVLIRPGTSWLAAAGVRYVMTTGSQPLPGAQAVFRADGVTIGEVPGVRPFAFVPPSVVPARSMQQAVAMLSRNPLGPTVVEGKCCHMVSSPGARVVTLSRQAGAIDVTVTARHPATLVVLQSFAPGWVARVDGSPVPISPANVLFQAVRVPSGRHRVTLRYEPSSLQLGLLVSGAGVLVLIAMVLGLDRPLTSGRRTS